MRRCVCVSTDDVVRWVGEAVNEKKNLGAGEIRPIGPDVSSALIFFIDDLLYVMRHTLLDICTF